jgi:hypothetical protein
MDTDNTFFDTHVSMQLAVAIGHYQSSRSPSALAHAIGALRASIAENPFTYAGGNGNSLKSADLTNRTLEWIVRSGIDATKSLGDDAIAAKAVKIKIMDHVKFWWNSNDYSVDNGDTWTW